MARTWLATAVAALAACGQPSTSAPWLTAPTAESHARYFPLVGTPHDPGAPGNAIDCNACHPGASFREFHCTGCHTPAKTDPTHLGVAAGYESPPSSASCLVCHPSGAATMVDHARFFPVGAGTAHAGVGCAQCHTDPANRASTAALACDGCHGAMSGFGSAHTVAGAAILVLHTSQATSAPVPLSSPSCVRCHADAQVDRVASHSTDGSSFGKGAHQDAGCLTCHSGLRADKPFGAAFTSSPPGCVTCHPGGTGN